jgi:hypothetical protein
MRRPILLLMGVSLELAGVVWFWTVHNSATVVRVGGTGRWNRGPLTVAERTYFSAGIDRILFAWRDLNAAAGLGSDAAKRSTEPNDPAILAIDLEGKAMWIERRGLRLQPYRALLPEDLAWRMYREGVPGQESFHGVLRLAMEGGGGSGSYDRFDLIGEGPGWYLQAEPSHPLDGTRLVETAFKPEDLQTEEHRRKTQVVMRSMGTICVLVPSYDTETPCATAVIGVTRTPYSSNPEEGMEWVRLEKVSFRPGSDHGFRLVYPAEPPATRGHDHDT